VQENEQTTARDGRTQNQEAAMRPMYDYEIIGVIGSLMILVALIIGGWIS